MSKIAKATLEVTEQPRTASKLLGDADNSELKHIRATIAATTIT